MPCHHNLEQALSAYVDGAALAAAPEGPLFRTIGRVTGELTRTSLPQANAHAMIRRLSEAAGIKTKIGNHNFRANVSIFERGRDVRAEHGREHPYLSVV